MEFHIGCILTLRAHPCLELVQYVGLGWIVGMQAPPAGANFGADPGFQGFMRGGFGDYVVHGMWRQDRQAIAVAQHDIPGQYGNTGNLHGLLRVHGHQAPVDTLAMDAPGIERQANLADCGDIPADAVNDDATTAEGLHTSGEDVPDDGSFQAPAGVNDHDFTGLDRFQRAAMRRRFKVVILGTDQIFA